MIIVQCSRTVEEKRDTVKDQIAGFYCSDYKTFLHI